MPTRKSNARKTVNGSLRADRAPRAEPARRVPEAPLPPAHLSEGAQAQWRALAPAAFELGTLTTPDLVAFALLAETLATAESARQTVAREGFTVGTGDGGSKPHPAVRIMETARGQARPLLHSFGLMPLSRQSMDIHPPARAGNAFAKYGRVGLGESEPRQSLAEYLAEGEDDQGAAWDHFDKQ
jgi:P27 family predicted phage terminase small subunit